MGCGVSHSRGQPSAAQDAPAAAWPTQAQGFKQVPHASPRPSPSGLEPRSSVPRPIKPQTPPSATIEITVYATPKHVRAAAASAQPSPASSPMRRLPTQMSPEGDRTAVEEFDQDLPAAARSGARSAGVGGGGGGDGGTSGGGGGIGAGVSAAASVAGQGAGSSQPGGSATTATAAAAAAAAAAAVAAIQRSTTPLGSGQRQLQQTLSFMVRRISAAIVAAPAEEVRTPERSGRSGGRTAVQGKSSDHVSHCAVSLQWLVAEFAKQHCRVMEGLTTEQVVEHIIKPATQAQSCRYTTLLMSGPEPSKQSVSQGRPFFFISHGWSRPFSELLVMLTRHFSPEQQSTWRRGRAPLQWSEVFVWVDIFAINQHPGDNQRNDLQCLKEVLADAQQTLMVLDQRGVALTRIWCLYEAWQTSRKGKGRLAILTYGIAFDPLEKVFLELDVAQAQARCIEDLENILDDIEQDCGIQAMNHDLKDALVAAVLAEVPPEDTEWTSEVGTTLHKAARLCNVYGRFEQAEPLLLRGLQGSERVLGSDDPHTLSCVNDLAALLYGQGKLEEAGAYYRRVVASLTSTVGAQHPDALTALSNLAVVCKAMGDYEQAESLCRQALAALKSTHGSDDNPDTLTFTNNLAAVLFAQGKYVEAESHYRKALEDSERLQGPEHPWTLTTANDLAQLLKARGQFGEAEALYMRALEGREKVLGPMHPTTHTTINNLASLLYAQGQYGKAEPLYRQTVGFLTQTLGPEHPDTLSSQNNLAALLKAKGDFAAAEPLYNLVLATKERLLGPMHPNTLISCNNLASLFKAQERFDLAEPLYLRALEGRQKVLGKDHPSTLSSLNNLAAMLMAQGRVEEAEPMFWKVLEGRQKVLGLTHPDTIASYEWLVELPNAEGREDVIKLLKRQLSK